MAILRIANENILDRALTLTAGSTLSSTYAVGNIQKDRKMLTHRTAAAVTSVQFDAVFTAAETFNFLYLTGNYSPTTTVRVRIYTNNGDATPILDTGAVSGGNAAAILLRGFTAAQAASAYAYGGGNSQRLYFTQTTGKWVVINIADASGLQGYVETSRCILGKYWSPVINCDYGVGLTYQDETTQKITAASDLTSVLGIRKRKVKFNLSKMREADRIQTMNLMRANGKGYPFFFSLSPGDTSKEFERDYDGWWKFSEISEMMMEFVDMQNMPMEILEM